MTRVRDGDHAAFERLYRKYQPALANFAMRYVDNPTRAEELAQDAILQIFRARGSYEPRARFSTYAHRVMINLCLNERRRNSRSPRMEPILGPGADEDERGIREVADERETPIVNRLEAAKQLEQVKKLLDSLPPKPRRALLMSRVYGYSCEEIAEEVEISPSAVKSL
ncbi:MAG: RNA polymerase sigma factor, partial [Candidatus Binatia bacterium]